MSYTKLVPFRDNKADYDDIMFHNAWGGVAFIWNCLCDRYLVIPRYAYYPDLWLELWEKAPNLPLEDFEVKVLLFSYDNALVKRERMMELADALDKFEKHYGVERKISGHATKVVCHLSAMANRLRILHEDDTVQCVGLYANSVCNSPWDIYDVETGDSEPYDLSSGTKHWFTDERTLEDEK